MGLQYRRRDISRQPWMRKTHAPVLKATPVELAEVDRLLGQMGSFAGQVRRAFLTAIERAGARIDVAEITRYLEAGRVSEAIDAVERAITPAEFAPVAAAISTATLTAGTSATSGVGNLALGRMNVTFGITNPRTIDFLRTYEFGLVRELTQQARASVASVIRQGVADGRNPLDVARDVRAYIGLTERQTNAVLNFRRALEDGSSSALDRALRDRRFDSTVQRAIDGETTLSQEQIDRMVGRYEQRYLKYRSETIARTEAIRAVNRGNLEAWRQAVADGVINADQVVRYWMHSHDEKVRDSHLLIPDMNADGVGIDEPFDSPLGPIMYPGDPAAEPANTVNCRCTQIIRFITPDGDEEDTEIESDEA